MKARLVADIDLYDLDIEPSVLADYIMSKHCTDVDVEFLNAYFRPKNWNSDEELREVVEGLTPGAIRIIERMHEVITEED